MALGIVGIVLALAAIALTIALERKRRPVLHIEAAEWSNDAVPWTFAAIRVVNEPLRGVWAWVVSRQSAEGCTVSFTIRPLDSDTPLIENMPGRWSGTPEPYRTDLQPDGHGNQIGVQLFDHRLVPDSFRFDVAAVAGGEEVAVAVMRDGKAYAFNSYSYAFPDWANPQWQVPPGSYELTVRARSAGDETSAGFALEVTDTALDLRAH